MNISPVPFMYVFPDRNCMETPVGSEYMGNISYIHSGEPCIRWDALDDPDVEDDYHYIDGNVTLSENHCRVPDSDDNPWCYLSTDITWGDCVIPRCCKFFIYIWLLVQ